MFFKNVTQPALKTIEDLRQSECKLRATLITKDDEIEQYKRLGGKIKYTAIPGYNDEEHMNKHNAFKEHFGDEDISKDLLDREVSLPSENVIKQEAQTEEEEIVKLEPQTESTDTNNENEVTTSIKVECIKTESKVTTRPKVKRKKFKI